MASEDRKERHRDKLREQILSTAMEIVARDGAAGLTIRHLADAIEYSPRTIYLYFQNRDAVLDGIVEKLFAFTALNLEKTGAMDDKPAKRISDQIQRHIRNGLENPELYRMVIHRIGAENYEPVPSEVRVTQFTAGLFQDCLPSKSLRDSVEEVTGIFQASLRSVTLMLIGRKADPKDPETRRTIRLYTRMTLEGLL